MPGRANEAPFIALVAGLLSAFSEGPPPPLDAASAWPEVAEAASRIDGHTWRTAPPEVLDAVHEALPWAGAEAFDYWLPGLLIDLAVDPTRAGIRADALILALTPTAPGDLAADLQALDRARASFSDATYAEVVRSVTHFHEHLRGPAFWDRWNPLTAAQRSAVREALRYVAREHARTDAAEALARLDDLSRAAG